MIIENKKWQKPLLPFEAVDATHLPGQFILLLDSYETAKACRETSGIMPSLSLKRALSPLMNINSENDSARPALTIAKREVIL